MSCDPIPKAIVDIPWRIRPAVAPTKVKPGTIERFLVGLRTFLPMKPRRTLSLTRCAVCFKKHWDCRCGKKS